MKVRLDRLGEEPFTWEETLTLSRDEVGPDVLELSDVGCRGKITRTPTGFLLELRFAYDETLGCTRCLGPVERRAEDRVDALVRVDENAADNEAEEQELEEEDLGVLVLGGPWLDTRPLVVEQLQLDVPMKVLCRDDCAGLCPECGTDRNDGGCECQPAGDPRWAVLERLKSSSR